MCGPVLSVPATARRRRAPVLCGRGATCGYVADQLVMHVAFDASKGQVRCIKGSRWANRIDCADDGTEPAETDTQIFEFM